MKATSPLDSSLAVLFPLFILGSKNAYATIPQIHTNIKLNKQANKECKRCQPYQHTTSSKSSNTN